MKKILFLVLLLIFIAGCVSQEDSVQRGMIYLNSVYEDGVYDDEYLLYVYPGEDLECPLENCKLTYRIMDAYFNLLFIKDEFQDYKIIKEQVDYADKVFKAIIPIWENSEIYNVIGGEKGFALDTYCILGYIYNDDKMASKVKSSLTNDNWMKDDYYKGEDEWRNIADESWCVRLLIKNGYNIDSLVDKKVKESYDFIKSSSSDMSKIVAVIHTLYILDDANVRDKDFLFFQEYVAENSEKFKDDNLLQANVLEVLSKTKYKDRIFLEKLASALIARQENSGVWYMNKELKENNAQVFTTFRAIIALNAYEKL